MKRFFEFVASFFLAAFAAAVAFVLSDSYFPDDGQHGITISITRNRAAAEPAAPVSGELAESHVVQIANGNATSAALFSDGTVRSWGTKNCAKDPYDRCTIEVESLKAEPVAGLKNIIEIGVGDMYMCALASNGTVACIDDRRFGNIGGNEYNMSLDDRPITFPELANITHISLMNRTACAVSKRGSVYCWGDLAPDRRLEMVPTRVEGIDDALRVATTRGAACALEVDGMVRCWGWSAFVGDDGKIVSELRNLPIEVPEVFDAVSLSANDLRFHAVLADGTVRGWDAADIFNNRCEDRPPYRFGAHPISMTIPDVVNAVSIESGLENEACAVLKDGSVNCWQWLIINDEGRFVSALVGPMAVPGVEKVARFWNEMRYAYAILQDKTAIAYDSHVGYWEPLW